MQEKDFKIICPVCEENADIVSYRRKERNKLEINYICPYCVYGQTENTFMYE